MSNPQEYPTIDDRRAASIPERYALDPLEAEDIPEQPKRAEQEPRALTIGSGGLTIGGGDTIWITNTFVGAPIMTGNVILPPVVDPIAEMKSEIEQLRARVAVLEEEVQTLRASAQEEVIVLRTVSKEQAKQEIRDLFGTGQTLHYSDIVQQLRLDISLVVELCKELENEGEVTTLGDAT